MAPPTRTPPSKWIDEALRALAAGGPDAVRVEALARALGVAKGGFYKHFDDRPAPVEEMLDTWGRVGGDRGVAGRRGRVDNRRADYLRSLLGAFIADEREVELRCLIALALFVGVPSSAADHGPHRRGELHKQAWERLLER